MTELAEQNEQATSGQGHQTIRADLGYLTESEASLVTLMGIGTLRNWRSQGKGPPFAKAGKTVLYPRHLLVDWLESQTVVPANRRSLISAAR